jgi:hypothetical protein
MSENFCDSPVRIQVLRDSPAGPALEEFTCELSEANYAIGSSRPHIRAAGHFIYLANRQGIRAASASGRRSCRGSCPTDVDHRSHQSQHFLAGKPNRG